MHERRGNQSFWGCEARFDISYPCCRQVLHYRAMCHTLCISLGVLHVGETHSAYEHVREIWYFFSEIWPYSLTSTNVTESLKRHSITIQHRIFNFVTHSLRICPFLIFHTSDMFICTHKAIYEVWTIHKVLLNIISGCRVTAFCCWHFKRQESPFGRHLYHTCSSTLKCQVSGGGPNTQGDWKNLRNLISVGAEF